jgi:hypothetical protein
VVTDGVSNNGYAPKDEAQLIKDENVNVFSVGVGKTLQRAELIDMASEPVDANVLALKNFEQLAAVVASVSAQACDAASIVNVGEQTSTKVANCETKVFQPACGTLQKTTITATTLSGQVGLYVSTKTSHPNPYNYEIKGTQLNEKTQVVTFERASGNTDQHTVAVRGEYSPRK